MKFLILLTLAMASSVSGLAGGDASLSRALLSQSFSSPSGKLTFSPEIIIPEPSDPTAILLQSNAVQGLSSKIREGKASAAFLKCSLTALKTFCGEQESARGNFPGPIPVVYCGAANNDVDVTDLTAVAEAGADGLLIRVACEGADSIADSEKLTDLCKQALDCGMQPIPELSVSESSVEKWDDEEVPKLVEKIAELVGSDPVALLMSIKREEVEQSADDGAEEEATIEPVPLPSISKELKKRVPIIGSIREMAGEGRLGMEANRLKDAGFASGLLCSECLPGLRFQVDMELLGTFWAGCIVDLKSTKSKNFSFRAKNQMETSAMSKWGNYQKSVIESGALGDPSESYSVVDGDAGEYKGF
eukprot:CAMPEP_0172445298 /NCGR_PEP_ID=MMETSP1065-20121228/5152_1 /TAXON_ID=265537 /ORGANISM="Amphiprora paludosa, Strain CCMP125" /LENGTH=360 /DNA_ID=CAMNT_0013196097 /DNA_START=79 /DNA_END=1161 /DNA_ORIENTATION=+